MIPHSQRAHPNVPPWLKLLAALVGATLLLACPPDDDIELSDCLTAVGTPDITCAAPPDTFSTASLQGTATGSAWDAWAWSSFAALNWPALASSDSATYPSGFVRGVPDLSKHFASAVGTDATVWETFKEKRELFNSNATADSWQQVTFDSTYAPAFLGGNVEACAGIDEVLHAKVQSQPRIISQIAKTNSGDETAEVASPAQESQDALCAGYTTTTNPTLEDCMMNFEPPPGGDGSTEFNASEPNYRTGVGPRVFKGSPAAENFIYYEVKLNYDYYRYVASNGLNDYDTAVQMSADNEIFLPYRTSAQAKPGDSNTDSLVNYSAAATQACYQNALNDCPLATAWGTVSVDNPPQLGAIQLKAAWLPTALLDGDPSKYHTTQAVYYRSSANQPEGLCYDVEEFGLLGLHIIQRVHGGDASATNGEPIGGTFIFATWEHESIADGAGYSYVNYASDQGKEQEDPMPYPNTAEGIQVSRLQTYPLATTATVTTTVHGDLPSTSVWQNYRLIGTQFQAIGDDASSLALGQPYYLANLVIETNRGLQQFQGQAPYLRVTDHYTKKGIPPPSGTLPSPHFSPDIANMVFNGTAINMGGCMGCHGNAQSQGYTFSFVLLDGSKGTKPDTRDDVLVPPVILPTTSAGS